MGGGREGGEAAPSWGGERARARAERREGREYCIYVPVRYFRARIDELRIFLEVEAWEVCPVRSSFTIHSLRVCIPLCVRVCMCIMMSSC